MKNNAIFVPNIEFSGSNNNNPTEGPDPDAPLATDTKIKKKLKKKKASKPSSQQSSSANSIPTIQVSERDIMQYVLSFSSSLSRPQDNSLLSVLKTKMEEDKKVSSRDPDTENKLVVIINVPSGCQTEDCAISPDGTVLTVTCKENIYSLSAEVILEWSPWVARLDLILE